MSKMPVAKVTLSTGKVVLLRDLKISDTETAAEMVAHKAGNNSALMQLLMQKALLQMVLVQVDGKKITGAELEQLDSLFKVTEYGQLLQVIQKMSGGDEVGKLPKMELVTSSE